MSVLPDELWNRILEIVISTSRLGYRDLCCLAIVSRRLNRLSEDSSLWATLLALDFPSSDPPQSPSKSLYKTKFERDKARRVAAMRRLVLSAESRVDLSRKRLADLEDKMVRENARLKAAVEEMTNLERVKRASVALKVWQPEVVRGRQKQIVEQCTVPVDSRLSSLLMEIRVCKQQIVGFVKTYNNEKQKLSEYKEAVTSLKYHPLQISQLGLTLKEPKVKGKKLKLCESAESSR
ncbi:F-box protein SKIP24 [Typha angustifolia]|uniref:F-box protein SKIP24 n=1 Tax=Typha angustifolia TaxID=59011 RepID=UPI003C3089A6